ncbi:holin [Massilia luteola]|uniref:holin n=1 Tax=Massilia luteola TaxID=3081751 RepID=UPI002ACC2E40|nr:holin [Massilia sp. Gc5]
MSRPSIFGVVSYVAGAASIGASLTLADVGTAVGIATAVLTCVTNTVYTYRRDRREQRECDARIAQLERLP